MHAKRRKWTERNGPSVARFQAASSRCRRAGWDRDRRSGRRHLRLSASICVHLRSTFLSFLAGPIHSGTRVRPSATEPNASDPQQIL